jgi:hypothetical protein
VLNKLLLKQFKNLPNALCQLLMQVLVRLMLMLKPRPMLMPKLRLMLMLKPRPMLMPRQGLMLLEAKQEQEVLQVLNQEEREDKDATGTPKVVVAVKN